MFDPHRIGPRRSSSYARNKGRVIQRKLVNTPSPGYTRSELEQLVPLMQKNGLIPSPPSPDFGRVVSFSVMNRDGIDVSNNYREVTPEEVAGGYVSIESMGSYVLYVPVFDLTGSENPAVLFRPVNVNAPGDYSFYDMPAGTRLYLTNTNRNQFSYLVLYGENGTSIRLVLVPLDVYEDTAGESVAKGSVGVLV